MFLAIQNYLKTQTTLFAIFIWQHIRCTLPPIDTQTLRNHNYL